MFSKDLIYKKKEILIKTPFVCCLTVAITRRLVQDAMKNERISVRRNQS